ncbi:hypothetical protein GCM10007049_10460 [Echinicola pacifica]|uniref:PDZ domain-containing protein n=1 Tax=Echinicola pacifica TaxID=346377 RepID=A0A918PSL2_9BACT|nr:PDZ domain-containing protein [Echinicola pacifica]GGZ19815.1 hypothetical protein GCM10007049_10460 [Echinicola pacifica]
MTLKNILIPLFFILNLGNLSLAQVPGFYMKEEKNSAIIPFLKNNNLIIVPVVLNGSKNAYNFLVDTGVKSNILFSKSIGDSLNMNYTRTLNLMGADGNTVLTALVSPHNNLDMGEVEGRLQAILVLQEDFLELERVIGIPIHGIIGYEFFKFNPVKINYDMAQITFYNHDKMKWKPFGYRKINLTFNNYKPYVKSHIVQSNGVDLTGSLLIDTGANHGLLLNRETRPDISLPQKRIETDLGRSLGGDLFGFAGRVHKYKLGTMTFRRVITSYPEETEFSNIIIESGRMGSLGSDILARLSIIIDYTRGRMFYKKGADFHQAFEYDMSGLKIRMTSLSEKRYYISNVQEKSPASAANFKEGDEILSINLLPIGYWELSEINDLLKSEEGDDVWFTIRRNINGQLVEIEKKITLKKQI